MYPVVMEEAADEPTQPPTWQASHPLSPSSSPATLNDVAHELGTLQELANKGSWKSILEKVSRARFNSVLSVPHDHLTYLAFNVIALTKLRRFKDALAELDSLETFDSHHYRYETYPNIYPNRSGSMLPFALRWLHALVPIKLGDRQSGLDRFYLLLGFVRDRVSDPKGEAAFRVWRRREYLVLSCIIGQHVIAKEFGVCLDLIRDSVSRGFYDPALVSKLGFVLMQIGDLVGAKASFERVERLVDEGGEWMLGEVELRNLVGRNMALMYLVGKDYVSAVREYEECIERDPMDVVAINNKAICLLYLKDLSDSIKVLERALERVPTVAMNESLVVNLCSMYELAYVNHSDIKRTLSNWIAKVAPDDFDSSCTRI